MPRRLYRLLLGLFVALAALAAGGPSRAEPAKPPSLAPIISGWDTFRERFVTPAGRVLDTGNHEISHTEGQGWAMLFAEAADDRASFERIWRWTHTHLQRHDNALFSWRFDPADPKTPVSDRNDASDGDILIAWALSRAAHRWHDAAYDAAARRIAVAIRKRLLVRTHGQLVLLPGLKGFDSKNSGIVVNPSYYIFPALKNLARLAPSRKWHRLMQDGLRLLADARFGRWGLTPDWVDISDRGHLAPSNKFPPRFGFDAIRIPLYLIWGGEATEARLASYLDFWNDYGAKPIPAWTNVKDNAVAPYAGSTGFHAIVELARGFGTADPPPLPAITKKDKYYAASLTLLAAMARHETHETTR